MASSSPSGNSNVESKEPSISSSTYSSSASSLTSTQPLVSSNVLAHIPMWSGDAAHMTKPLPIAQKWTRVSKAPGASASHSSRKRARVTTSTRSPQGSSQENEWHQLPLPTQVTSFGTTEESGSSRASHQRRSGAMSASSSSSALPTQASRRASTKPLEIKFTLSQAKSLFGLTGTMANAASSLTTMRSRLNAKLSYESWMDILSNFKSREALCALDLTLSCSHATRILGPPSPQPFYDESQLLSTSRNSEEPTETSSSGSDMEDNRLEEDMTSQESPNSSEQDEPQERQRSRYLSQRREWLFTRPPADD